MNRILILINVLCAFESGVVIIDDVAHEGVMCDHVNAAEGTQLLRRLN